MSLFVSPNQSTIQGVLRNFVLSVLPASGSDGNPINVIAGQDNRVPEPQGTDFIVMTPIRRSRLATNIDTIVDSTFVGSISGNVLTVTAILGDPVPINVGVQIFGPTIAPGTVITGLIRATGGVGTYQVSPAQTALLQKLSAGTASFTQQTDVVFQLDVHSANTLDSADMAQTISTMFRDSYATSFFASQNQAVIPLLADDPKQIPFMNAENQYETRWVVEARVQANQTVQGGSQEFCDSADITLINIDAKFPPPISDVFTLDDSELGGPDVLGN
jgi:hypothetical protein